MIWWQTACYHRQIQHIITILILSLWYECSVWSMRLLVLKCKGHCKGYVQCCVWTTPQLSNNGANKPVWFSDPFCNWSLRNISGNKTLAHVFSSKYHKMWKNTLIDKISTLMKAIDPVDIAVYLGTRHVTSCLCKVWTCHADTVSQQEIYLLYSIYWMKSSQYKLPSSLLYKVHFSRQLNCWSLRCSWSIACRRCSNYIFILNLTPDFNGLDKDNYKMGRETFQFWYLVRLILETLRYILMALLRTVSGLSWGRHDMQTPQQWPFVQRVHHYWRISTTKG